MGLNQLPAKSSIPIPGITNITFFTMEIRVHPITGATVGFLRNVMSAIPIPLQIVPQGLQRQIESQGVGKRFKFCQIHSPDLKAPFLKGNPCAAPPLQLS